MNLTDLIGLILGFLFTVLIFTYLIGDNPLFRLTIYIFIGVSAGIVAAVVFTNVILGQLVFPFLQTPAESLTLIAPAFFGLWLLLTKPFPRLANLGNPVMGFLVGVAAATAIGGAITGTLFPQFNATTGLFDLRFATGSLAVYVLTGLFILFGTIATFLYFHFGYRQVPEQPGPLQAWIAVLGRIGQYFIVVTFGALFAGVYASAIAALVERLQSIVDFIRPFFTL
jgi:hypothetical protein